MCLGSRNWIIGLKYLATIPKFYGSWHSLQKKSYTPVTGVNELMMYIFVRCGLMACASPVFFLHVVVSQYVQKSRLK